MDSIKKWLDEVDSEEKQPITESACSCALYTCKACFPDHYPANDQFSESDASKRFNINDVVKVNAVAGNCLATVTETKGVYLKVIRESDNATILIHHSDAILHEAFVPGMEAGEIDMDFPDARDNLNSWEDSAVSHDAQDDVSEMIADILSYQEMGVSNDKRNYTETILHQLTPEAVKRIHGKVVGMRVVESEEDTRQFDEYESACKAKHGRVIGRSKFLALSSKDRAAAISKLSEAPSNNAKRVTAKKYQGDDAYSWAVFVDGRPVVTGLSRSEVAYYKKMALKQLEQKNT